MALDEAKHLFLLTARLRVLRVTYGPHWSTPRSARASREPCAFRVPGRHGAEEGRRVRADAPQGGWRGKVKGTSMWRIWLDSGVLEGLKGEERDIDGYERMNPVTADER